MLSRPGANTGPHRQQQFCSRSGSTSCVPSTSKGKPWLVESRLRPAHIKGRTHYVANLVIISTAYRGKVRAVVRTSDSTVDPRHPGTVSMVTTEVDFEVADDVRANRLMNDRDELPIQGSTRIRNQVGTFGEIDSLSTAVGRMTHAAFSKLWDAKGDRGFKLPIKGQCQAKYVQRLLVGDPKGTNLVEDTVMITIVADVAEMDADRIPRTCKAYTDSRWVDYRTYLEAVARRDGQMVVPDGNPWELCLFGACNQGAAKVIDRCLLPETVTLSARLLS